MTSHQSSDPHVNKRSRWVFWGFAVVAAFYLLTEHREHLLGWAPYLIFLLCPLMHLFHGHHGHHRDVRNTDSSASTDRSPPK